MALDEHRDDGGRDGPEPPRQLDVNCDLGESYGRWQLGDDDAMLRIVTSANVACGFHAGDPTAVRRACAGAAAHGVVVGAQVGYPDLHGFGRRFMDMAAEQLADAVVWQVATLRGLCEVEGATFGYVKPHGALYHAVSTHPEQGEAVVAAIRAVDPGLAVLAAAGSAFLELVADAGLRAVPEAFADRGYAPDGTLLPRDRPGAVLADETAVRRRAVELAAGHVTTAHGATVPLRARSVCVHGDTSSAPTLARALVAELADRDVAVRPFVS